MVFGASGFLGAEITNNLSIGQKVIAVTRETSPLQKLTQNRNLKVLSISEKEWPSLIGRYLPDVVICAQWEGVDKSSRDVKDIQMKNVSLILELARAAQKVQSKKFIALGSQAESAPSSSIIRESYIDSAVSWYGKSKVELHRGLRTIFSKSETSFVWARVFSVYGPGETRDSLISELLSATAAGRSFRVREPNRLWSFLYISDFAEAIKAIVLSSQPNLVFNIANPNLSTIKEIGSCVPGSKLLLEEDDYDASVGFFPEIRNLLELNWKPIVTLNEGCRMIVESADQIHN